MKKQYEITLMLRYLQKHYTTITLPEFARFFGYSTRQMNRILISYTGKSFQDHVQDIRMRQAIAWLREEKYSIIEIAEKPGYATTSNFRKIFKKYYDMSPKQYQMERRNAR